MERKSEEVAAVGIVGSGASTAFIAAVGDASAETVQNQLPRQSRPQSSVFARPFGACGCSPPAKPAPPRREWFAQPQWLRRRRPYFGTVGGGVALGTLIAVSAVPPVPAPGVCWYWAEASQTQGYWDYCQ